MVTRLYPGVIILAIFATTDANTGITVVCANDSVSVTWRISAEMVPHAARLFLGSCMPSELKDLPNGEGEVLFNYQLADCKFKKLIKRKRLLYQNEMTYRPQPRSKPAAYVYRFECAYKRPDGWVPPFLYPGSGFSVGRGELVFRMLLLNDRLTATADTNVVPRGSFLPIWATVEQKSHQPLLLLMDECVAASVPELQPGSLVHPIIGNKGCLLDSFRGNAVFLPRHQTSSLVLYLQSSRFPLGKELYIHCKLVAWDPDALDGSKKACHYVKETGRWELLDDPFQSSLCSCCDSTCKSRSRRGVERESRGFSHKSLLGPLIIVDPSDLGGSQQMAGLP